jgi:hypothetical protein
MRFAKAGYDVHLYEDRRPPGSTGARIAAEDRCCFDSSARPFLQVPASLLESCFAIAGLQFEEITVTLKRVRPRYPLKASGTTGILEAFDSNLDNFRRSWPPGATTYPRLLTEWFMPTASAKT